MHTDVRQSQQYAQFMTDIGWQVKKIDSTFIYLKKFPLLGNYAKIPRSDPPLPCDKIKQLIKNRGVFRLKIAPNKLIHSKNYLKDKNILLTSGFKIDKDPFIPTTTIWIDLTCNEQKLFASFSEAKRRAVRRASKLGVKVKQSNKIDLFINLRQRQYFPFGLFFSKETKKLWQNFYPENASLLLAFSKKDRLLAGVLLLYYKDIAYYWLASSLTLGKKLYAPTLLVWEAICLSKKKGAVIFDFEGIYDKRFPKANKSWQGFTKFKQGFGGRVVNYMENLEM